VRLYKQAAEHFAQGAKYGAMAHEKSLVLHAATNFWNAALSLMTSNETRWYRKRKRKEKSFKKKKRPSTLNPGCS
jgi:hypothetical protein